MDRVFLQYYEEELTHIRSLASEFSDMHPAVARNLSLDTVPCPDPYVERLLDGVAFLAARTRLKIDGERSRFCRAILDVLYPDLIAPTPATGTAVLTPGKQVQTMLGGHVVKRGAKLVSSLRPGLATRSTFTTAQDVTLWPVEIASVDYLQDRSALLSAGVQLPGATAEAALRITLSVVGKARMGELSLDRLDLHFPRRETAPTLFDSLFSACAAVGARKAGSANRLSRAAGPAMIGIGDDEALMPRTRPTFEGYRLLREYFMMPERFHYMRIDGLLPAVRQAEDKLEILLLLKRRAPELSGMAAADFALFATPVINLFERECDIVETDLRKTRQVLHADRTRPRDFEIYRPIRVSDADAEGAEANIPALFSLGQNSGRGWVYSIERRPRRPADDERRQGMTRTSYLGDDAFLAISRPVDAGATPPPARLDVAALCTNRDLPILDDQPTLILESGDPVETIRLLGALRPPRPAVAAALPTSAAGESRAEELAWRLISQLSLNFLSLAEEGRGADPLHAVLDLYAERGDPALARHVRSIVRIESRPVVERLAIPGPMCFGRGTEIVLHVDQSVMAGHSTLLLSALLSRLFARYAGVNGFVRTRTRLLPGQEDVAWPMAPGNRHLI
ncbi:MAG: type VI secretion system baseplate subunit TssF [Rhizobiaceae bacterium]|nr:type VI secretion system baseplate subunit TssF [Rhizobiaceae bacterium]